MKLLDRTHTESLIGPQNIANAEHQNPLFLC
jgi:hypothetical protein